MSRKLKKRTRKTTKRKIIIAVEIVILILLALVAYTYLKLGQINFFALNDIKTYKDTGPYTNIALFGLDSRDDSLGEGNHSDTIIIASINNKTSDIKLLSVYRDTYLQVEDGYYDKANAAYFRGGPEEAINMLNKNLDMDIRKYMTINFAAITHTVDALGGLDVEMTEEERVWMNGYVAETSESTGVWSPTIDDQTGDGVYHLNGTQATAFCRIRYTSGNDFKRTERQRLILNKIIEKAKTAKLRTLNKIIKKVFPMCMTNFTTTNLLGYAFNIKKFNLVDQQGFPQDIYFADLDVGSCVVPDSLSSNVADVHKFLFDDSDYTPSDNVESISKDIAYLTSTSSYYEEPSYDDYSEPTQPIITEEDTQPEEPNQYYVQPEAPLEENAGGTAEETVEPVG